MPFGKSFDKRGFSDPRLATNEDDASATRGHSREYALQLRKKFVAFQ
jgi:hypothetical protein